MDEENDRRLKIFEIRIGMHIFIIVDYWGTTAARGAFMLPSALLSDMSIHCIPLHIASPHSY